MNSNAVETLAVDAVKDSIIMSDYLDQCIPDKDKEPFWDGAIHIYNKKRHCKKNFRLPVQVKGTQNSNHSRKEISFSVSVVDLKGYLDDGGAIYFVVYISHDGRKKKIYYLELTPIRIRFILNSANSKKKVSLKFKEFPTDDNRKATIVMNCYDNCKRQSSFSNAKLYTIEELQAQGVLESLSMHLSGVEINEDPQMAFINNDVYLYANIKGSTIPQPIEILPQGLHTSETVDCSVTIEGKEYYSQIKVIKSSTNITYVIGESFTVKQDNVTKKINYSYISSDNLQVIAKDLDFMLAYIDAGYFELHGKRFPFNKKNADFSNFNIEDQRKNLKTIKELTQVLDSLGCKKKLKISSLSADDNANLSLLKIAFVDKKSVSGLVENIPTINRITIGNLNLILLFIPQEDNPTTYNIRDFFASEILVKYTNEKGIDLPISQYGLLTTEDFVKADNLKYEILLPSFQKIEKHEETYERANWLLLNLLSAYDQTKKAELLNTAKNFSEWILSATDEEMPYNIKMLNHLQIIKRLRPLNEVEKQTILKIVTNDQCPPSTLVGAYILLEQYVSAKIHFNNMPSAEQEEFKNYPIYNLWETREKS